MPKHFLKLMSLLLCAVFITVFIGGMQIGLANNSSDRVTGTVEVSDTLNVRTGPGTDYARLTNDAGEAVVLYPGVVVDILESVNVGSSVWYKISFVADGITFTGYSSSSYIRVNTTKSLSGGDAAFETQLAAFPESYRQSLRELHTKYPEWKFVAFNTGLDWNTVQEHENVLGRSLISTSVLSYRSVADGAYDSVNNRWIALDGSAWYQAAPEVVAYYMDPRNFLTEKQIFQFEALSFDRGSQTSDGVAAMLKSSFMEDATVNNGLQVMSYAQAFMYAAEASGVSPYHLASRVIQEVGWKGSQSIWGTTSGYEGIYNYYNIGATSSATPVLNGLRFASTGGGLSAEKKLRFLIPWNSRYKALVGGAVYIGTNYINIGQNTIYLEKFDVDNSDGSLYWHQYMTNVMAASSEATRIFNTYSNLGALNEQIAFYIPVYSNMPASACKMPDSSVSPDSFLRTLSVDGYQLYPAFSATNGVRRYYVTPSGDVQYLNISASPVNSSASVSGSIGAVNVTNGINRLSIQVTAANGTVNTYEIIAAVNQAGFKPGDEDAVTPPSPPIEPPSEPPTEPPTEPPSEPPTEPPTEPPSEPGQPGVSTTYRIANGRVLGVQPGTDAGAFLSAWSVRGNASVTLLNRLGEPMTGGPVGTGCSVRTVVNGVQSVSTVIVRGDVDGDGVVGAVDLLMVRKKVLGTYTPDEYGMLAADADSDGSIGAVDLLMIRKHILNVYTIVQ